MSYPKFSPFVTPKKSSFDILALVFGPRTQHSAAAR